MEILQIVADVEKKAAGHGDFERQYLVASPEVVTPVKGIGSDSHVHREVGHDIFGPRRQAQGVLVAAGRPDDGPAGTFSHLPNLAFDVGPGAAVIDSAAGYAGTAARTKDLQGQ